MDRELGRGGMGVVYLARDVGLERLVAVKVLGGDRARDPAARARFLREARTAAILSHPNIVPIHAVEEVAGLVYYVMAYVDGETLGERVRARGPLAPADAVRILRDVAWALAYAHARGIVHRDVKPDNILVEAGSGRALVTDFGIARHTAGPAITGPHRVFGTAEFMSPEQAAGRPTDGRSDVYSLGVVAFFLLSGRVPFTAPDPHIVLHCHATVAPPPLRLVAPAVPHRVARLVERCLAKDPAARFGRCEELAEALTQVLQERTAPPVAVRAFATASRHLTPWARLYALLAGSAAACAAAGAALFRPGLTTLLLGAGAVLVAALLPAAVLTWRVRRFIATGHDREDLLDFLHGELGRRREELAFAYGRRASGLEWVLRALSYGALGGAAGCVLAPPPGLDATVTAASAGAFALAALFLAVLGCLRREQRVDPSAGRRVRFWAEWPGALVFRLAALGRHEPAGGLPAAAPAPVGTFLSRLTPRPSGP